VNYIVSVSSGVGSAYAWHLTALAHPGATTGVFADVNGEDADNYRFLDDVHRAVGGTLVRLDNDGKTIWDVFKERRFLGNSRVDLCSRILKREAILTWLKENHDPADTVIVLGIDWTEEHRFIRAKARWANDGWVCEAPLCARDHDKSDAERWLADAGIAPPMLYSLGYSHANCGGMCVKMGIGQAKHTLRVQPARYAEWEARENEMRELLGDVAMLRDRRTVWVDGVKQVETSPLTLAGLRERLALTPTLFDDEGWGDACGCFTGDEEPDDLTY
jgi:hypothetical protein